VGVPEVLGQSFPGNVETANVRALLLGTRIDTRNIEGLNEPDGLILDGIGAAFVFRYGVLVLFGASPEIEQGLIASLDGHVIEPMDVPELETASIEIRAGSEELVRADGHVLARDEARIADAFDRVEPLVTDLREQGRALLPIRRVMQHIGDVLAAQHRVVGRAQIGEKPDMLWDHPELDRLYARLEAEFELNDRARAIERKLEVVGDAADVLLNLVQDKRSHRLEIAVIVLIGFEILLNLYHLA
jgi:uncharacterized Rmd1/YagE family protein